MLARRFRREASVRVALVGAGGSGKSTLACAVGHRVRRAFPGGTLWFRVGAWDARTLSSMVALRLGLPARAGAPAIAAELDRRGRTFIVLDNHEDDRAVATLLDALGKASTCWLITARRCLVAGVAVFPVVAPMVGSGRSPFPRVASLTALLRWNPLALELADAFVGSRAVTAGALRRYLVDHGIERIRALEHEDDLPEVELLLDWALPRLSAPARRMLAVLAHVGGDHVDASSLRRLARAPGPAPLRALQRFRLVQEPLAGRFALHATVRHVLAKRTRFDAGRLFDHYVKLVEEDPARFELEQTHLFAAMDYAHEARDITAAMRVDALVEAIERMSSVATPPTPRVPRGRIARLETPISPVQGRPAHPSRNSRK